MWKTLRLATAMVLLVGSGLLNASCAPPKLPPNLTPSEQAAYKRDVYANEAVVTIGSLQHTAIELNKVMICASAEPTSCHQALSEANTRVVVRASNGALKVIQAVPSGWKAATDVALEQIENELDATGKTKFMPWVMAARGALAALPQQN